LAAVNQFLRHLHRQGKPVEATRPADVAAFVEEKRKQYEKRHGGAPPSERKWRSGYTGPIHRMLRLVDAEWPRAELPGSESERLQRSLLEGYGRWLTDDHGLSEATRKKNSDDAQRFLSWLDSRGRSTLMDLTVVNIDAYLAWRLAPLRRATRSGICNALRSFLRYLHYEKLVSRDLAPAVMGPHLCQFEEIPRAFSKEQVRAVVRCTRQDRSPIGLRDYAMLLLLATYGLRAGEILHLRLEDIDWREERLRIRHSKTGYETFLPLVTPVGEALLAYLQKGRPKTKLRQVFLQAIAPYQAFKAGGSLRTIIHYRLQKAGVKPTGHQGAHAFRFARVHSLLCASVPRKIIGDLLGHRDAASTAVYLKLVTEDLRAVSLDLPKGGNVCRTGLTKTKRS
jgi:integrase/recombinase XerD